MPGVGWGKSNLGLFYERGFGWRKATLLRIELAYYGAAVGFCIGGPQLEQQVDRGKRPSMKGQRKSCDKN